MPRILPISAARHPDIGSCRGAGCTVCAALRAAVPRAVRAHGIAGLEVEHVAAAAGVRGSVALAHTRGDATGLLGQAYLESAGALQRGFAWASRSAVTPRDGLRDAVTWLLATLAEDGDRALFCYVEVVKGGGALLALREQIRQSSVAIWAAEYRCSAPDRRLPRAHFELVNSAAISLIATRAAQDRAHELRAMPETILALTDAHEASAARLSLVR